MWSVELFFFFMVIHLWGKYWMAAWRGGRARVWMTGAVTFLVAIPCALTGYVSQQNFDAQWISTQAKDAMNAAGIGSFFNLMNFGQMYSYHVFLLPAAVVALVDRAHPPGAQARDRAAVRAGGGRREAGRRAPAPERPRPRHEPRARRRRGRVLPRVEGCLPPVRHLREASIALGIVLALTVVLTILFSSPDDPPSTIKSWSRTMPVDFVTTATTELDGTSGPAATARRTTAPRRARTCGSSTAAKWFGIAHPINTAQDFVLAPLRSLTQQPAVAAGRLHLRGGAGEAQMAWTSAYEKALSNATATASDGISVKPGSYGPLPTMMGSLLTFAQSGGLDGALLTSKQFYQTDYTKPLMFMADGGVLTDRAMTEHLLGTQWGMMNETGSYPGQVWLWLYTFWYQIKPFSTSTNADILVMAVMGVLSLAFVLVPFLPGVRDLPRRIPIYKLIWRDHYRAQDTSSA